MLWPCCPNQQFAPLALGVLRIEAGQLANKPEGSLYCPLRLLLQYSAQPVLLCSSSRTFCSTLLPAMLGAHLHTGPSGQGQLRRGQQTTCQALAAWLTRAARRSASWLSTTCAGTSLLRSRPTSSTSHTSAIPPRPVHSEYQVLVYLMACRCALLPGS